jgi:hypothetical protein
MPAGLAVSKVSKMEDTKKLKHLEFIQSIVSRLGNNSFLVKGWSITIMAALAALSSKDANQKYLVVAFFPVVVFYFLDSYYLWQERCFRAVYDEVRKKNEDHIDFSMKFSSSILKENTYIDVLFSKTILPFYGALIGTILILMKII